MVLLYFIIVSFRPLCATNACPCAIYAILNDCFYIALNFIEELIQVHFEEQSLGAGHYIKRNASPPERFLDVLNSVARKYIHDLGFRCNECNLKFLTPRKLRKHKKMAHVFTKTYACHFCDELFTSEVSVWSIHIYIENPPSIYIYRSATIALLMFLT